MAIKVGHGDNDDDDDVVDDTVDDDVVAGGGGDDNGYCCILTVKNTCFLSEISVRSLVFLSCFSA